MVDDDWYRPSNECCDSGCFFHFYQFCMKIAENIFVVPSYRLRDVGATIEAYDEHFWSNGHSVKMMVFDDSSLANHEKYFNRLANTKTVNDVFTSVPTRRSSFSHF